MSKRSSFFGFLPPLSPTKRSSSTSSSPSPSALSQLVRFAGSAQMLTEEVSAQSMTTDEGETMFHFAVCLSKRLRPDSAWVVVDLGVRGWWHMPQRHLIWNLSSYMLTVSLQTCALWFAYKVFRFVIHFYQNMVVLHMQTNSMTSVGFFYFLTSLTHKRWASGPKERQNVTSHTKRP